MGLKDILEQKQVLKFQLNEFSKDFIDRIIEDNVEGIFNLSSKISPRMEKAIFSYLNTHYSDSEFGFELDSGDSVNSRIYFKNYGLASIDNSTFKYNC